MGLEGCGEGVGGVGGGAAKTGGAGLAFGVGLDGEAGEVGNEGIYFVDFGSPPGFYGGVERVVGGQVADDLGAGDGYRHGEMDAPGAEGVGDAGDLLEVVGVDELRGGVDIVYVDAVDADGREQAAVFGDGGEVFADVAAFEEDAAACVAAFDGAVGLSHSSTQRILKAGAERTLSAGAWEMEGRERCSSPIATVSGGRRNAKTP